MENFNSELFMISQKTPMPLCKSMLMLLMLHMKTNCAVISEEKSRRPGSDIYLFTEWMEVI